MRCKNCGADNNDNRYICEVCGSPLYDETDVMPGNDNQKTQTFSAVNAQSARNQMQPEQPQPVHNNNNNDNKKSIIIIAILVVILVAIIASIIAIAHNNKKSTDESSSEPLTKVSSTADNLSTSENITEDEEKTTDEITTAQTTTEAPTTRTKWIINASSSGGGEVEGDGEYYNGDKVTLIARADDGYVFDGWYSNGIKVSSNTKYTFTANENASFSAVFNQVEYDPGIDNLNGNEVNFGD